ncbi:uncharacterized protein BP01DRAFT_238527 [Aspergillus saccharolyticus JOP 1030-1]|uniref:Uncharacterized protein n=1 Tax=Aspergillus saccharolyticus JOP 1030-1 TaxID=1450539 RepID=A0A318ZR52_9EURO|nr:hypothetical protein BP01DRAFT_238527 [Aspergillus saccharolyticus JOP 1030-1]PYH46843.1 hypothetical protein BP01DRAFT_238527 [Aspergillus saccharolyticus JOP 1030-1]
MEHSTPYSQPSPPSSVADQTWDKALIEDPAYASQILDDEINDASSLPARLIRLARLVSESNLRPLTDSTTLHQYVEKIEDLLDPRPALSQEIARCRPRASSRPPSPESSPRSPHINSRGIPLPSTADPVASVQEISHSQLKSLLGEITTMKAEFSERRKESLEIHSLLIQERQALNRRLSELDEEIHELRNDILEDSAEREAMQGTINGLEIWLDDWHKHHMLAVAERPTMKYQRKSQRRWTRCSKEEQYSTDGDVLFEGIAAWMRGWKDVEEGFQNRQRGRHLRREQRRKEQMQKAEGPFLKKGELMGLGLTALEEMDNKLGN